VEIVGRRHTTAIAVRPYSEDEGLQLVRLDGLQRANAGVGSGDHVEIKRAEARPATRVVFAPAQKNLRLQGSGEALRRTFYRRPLVAGDVVSTSVHQRPTVDRRMPDELRGLFDMPAYGLQEIRLMVVQTVPKGIVQVTAETEVELRPHYEEPKETRRADVTYDDIGGLGDTVDQVREMVELPLRHPELFQRLGIDPPKGVLLYGPPGTGKTLLARAVANECEAQFFHIAGPEIMGKHYGESEQRLRDVFNEAQRNAPSIVFIDEIDSIAPKRENVQGEVERRIVAQLLTLMDGLEPRQNIVVMAATNRREAIDEALRRPGRFDREIIIGVPDQDGRREVLAIHTRGMPLTEDVDLDEVARVTYGFVGADLSALAREAAMERLRKILPDINLKDGIPADVLESLRVAREDFLGALKRVQPSALREIMIQVPNVSWDDIGGLMDVRTRLREGIELPLKNPEAFRRIGIRPAKGFLLFGPPGTGKTLLAKAGGAGGGGQLRRDEVVGSTLQVVRRIRAAGLAPLPAGAPGGAHCHLHRRDRQPRPRARRGLGRARRHGARRQHDPRRDGRAGGIAGRRRRGGDEPPDPRRPGAPAPRALRRADLRAGPRREGRRHILGIHTRTMPLAEDVSLDEFAERTARYTGADLEDLTRRAGLLALRESLDSDRVTRAHFEQALKETRASVTPEMERDYEEMVRTLKQEGPTRQRVGFIGEGA
jgi:transitional endoplasmic reticulum ATPase